MKVELSIKDDKELRDMIKDMIRGQIVSITREEIHTILTEVLNKKYSEVNKMDLPKMIETEMKTYLREETRKVFIDAWSNRDLLRDYARQEVNRLIVESFKNGRIV